MTSEIKTQSLVAALPCFSGEKDENVHAFIRNIEDICSLNANNWPEAKKVVLLRLHCKGKAGDFVNCDPSVINENNFQKLSQSLINKFAKQVSFQEVSHKFSNIVQKPNQNVRELAEYIKKTAQIFVENRDNIPQVESLRSNLMFTKFMEAVRSDIKVELLKFAPSNFEDAVKKAQDIEKSLDQQSLSINNLSSTQSIDIQILLQQQIENNKQIQELTETVRKLSESQAKIDDIRCHICNRKHKTTDCYQFPNNSRSYNGNSSSNFNSRFQGRGRSHYRPYSFNRRGRRSNLN